MMQPTGESDYIPNVAQIKQWLQKSIYSDAESTMRNRSILTQFIVPLKNWIWN